MRLTGASVSLYAVSGESTRGTIAERQTKHTPKMTIVQRRYFIQSPKLLLGLRASEMLVNVKSVQRKAGIASFRVLREGSSFCAAIQAWQVAHSFRVLCGKKWETRMQIQPLLGVAHPFARTLRKGWVPDSQSEAEQAALHARRAGHRVLDGESMRQLPAAYGHQPRPGITSREAALFQGFLESAAVPFAGGPSL